jgi:hypothetical protein
LERYSFKGFQPLLFCDSVFGFDKRQYREFTDLYIKEGLNKVAPWKCLVVANGIDDDWARRAKDSGCFAVDMGLEHSDEKFRMETLGKMITDDDFKKATTFLVKYGIPYELYLLIGSRGENFQDALKNIRKARRFRPLLFCINVYVPLPETKLWNQYRTKKNLPGLPQIEKKESAFGKYMLLVWGIKFLNQLMIINTARKLHGIRLFSISFRFFIRLCQMRATDLVDAIRLYNHHIQQYYIYKALSGKIKDRTYPVDRDVFYKKP